MAEQSAVITTGTRILLDGDLYQVVALTGSRVSVRALDGREASYDLRYLATYPGVRFPDQGDEETLEVVGDIFAGLTTAQLAILQERLGHVREVLTGYRDEPPEPMQVPRAEYLLSKTLGDRQAAKAAELGVAVRTVRRWCDVYVDRGPAGAVDRRTTRSLQPLKGLDPRWIEALNQVVAQHEDASRTTLQLLLERIAAHLEATHGPSVVPVPKRERARRAVRELTRGTNALKGSTKGKRSIANRPIGTYGSLRATRPGEYVLLDTTRLDVFAMEPVTLRWVSVELTVAMDLYSRAIVGLRLTPVSTKSVDVAAVLYDAIGSPDPQHPLAFVGIPDCVVVPPACRSSLPMVCPETLVIDQGKVYVSEHTSSICARLGMSIQPGRPYTPTDKPPVERFFETLGLELLVALPGYKGPDVHSRGANVEKQAYYFIDELEALIREWVVKVYHQRPHGGLIDEHIPGLRYTPQQRLEAGIARAGFLRIPNTPDLVLDFLPVRWRTIQHYGVEIDGLRYNGPALDGIRNRTSPHGGRRAGKWPFRVDPNNRQHIHFHNPETRTWHQLDWSEKEHVPQPFSTEVLSYARRLAVSQHEIPDTRRALNELLDRWSAGRVANPQERRMWLRLSENVHQFDIDVGSGAQQSRKDQGETSPLLFDPLLQVSDDDTDDELLADDGTQPTEDYYSDAFGVAL